MGFWVFMLICALLTPSVMAIFGLVYVRGGYPKEINETFGYRTKTTKRNQEVWEYSQKLFGKIWLTAGAVLLPLSVVPMLFVIGDDVDACALVGGVTAAVQIVIILLLIPVMEKAVKKRYP